MMDGVDRISELPEPILHDILSLLPWEDAAHMSVLSKRFQGIWKIFPVFNFSFEQVFKQDIPPCDKCSPVCHWGKILRKGSTDLIHVVDQALSDIRLKKAIIPKFSLCINFPDAKDLFSMDSWMELVSKNCLRELQLELSMFEYGVRYCLSPSTFATNTLEVLRLWGCKLEKPLFIDGGTFRSLKVVSFVEVCLDDEFVNSFFVGCPLLKDFTLDDCVGFEMVNANATNLELFRYVGDCEMLNISDASFRHLRKLELICLIIKDDFVEDLLAKLPLVQNLTLNCNSGVTRVQISHSLLEKLHLSLGTNLEVLDINIPLLLSFVNVVKVPALTGIFTLNAPSLRESSLTFGYDCNYHLDALWFLRLREYLFKCSQYNVIVFHTAATISFDPDELTEVEVPLVQAIKHLKLQEFYTVDSNYEPVLDGFLWSCHPDIVEVPYTSENNDDADSIKDNADFIKVLCKELLDRPKNPQCCTESQTRCWRHYLKDVSVHGLMTEEERDTFQRTNPDKRVPEVCFELKWDMN